MPIPQPHTPERVGRSKKWRIAGIALLTMAVVLGLVVMLWDWNWLRPLVEARASAALGRQVRMERLEVHPGRITTLVLHGVRIANPTGFDEPDVATVSTLTIAFEAETWLHTRKVVLPHIEVEQPSLHLTRNGAGQDNWTFAASAPTTPAPASASGPGGGPAVEIGDIVVRDVAARLRTEQPAAGVTLKLDSLEVGQGATRTLTGHGLRVTGPEGTDAPDVATIPSLTVAFESETWMNTGKIVLPRVEIGQPSLRLVQTAAGHDNWTFPALTSGSTTGPGVEIGDLVVKDGTAHLQMKQPAADVTLKIATGGTDRERTLVVDAKGTYDRQPITLHAVGGGLLSLRDGKKPYPVDIAFANGPTRATVKGTLRDPFALAGAELSLTVSGPDMELLFPLTGIPIPKTPPYAFTGKLGYGEKKFRLTDIKGRIGTSDINGSLEMDPHGKRPLLTGSLSSRQVDMQDLAGFIGAEPGRVTTPGQTARQVQEIRRAEASPKLLPTTTISVPKLLATDVRLHYQGDRILGRDAPFDSITVLLDIKEGHIRLDPLRFGLGGGSVTGYMDLNPVGNALDADVDVTMRHVNLGDLLAKAGLGSGQGAIDGAARLKGRGASMAAIVGQGEGTLRIVMPLGGQVNALLINLSGGEVGQALLAAIGLPARENIHCLVADFVLRRGIMASRALVVDTTDHLITGGGRIDLANEVLELRIRTDVKHFTIGKLASPIVIFGPFKKLSYGIDAEILARGGAAVGLGLLFGPAAILPTIQFGVGDDSPCAPKRR